MASICARPPTESSGRMWPPKKGPMMRATAAVAPRYFSKKSCVGVWVGVGVGVGMGVGVGVGDGGGGRHLGVAQE